MLAERFVNHVYREKFELWIGSRHVLVLQYEIT